MPNEIDAQSSKQPNFVLATQFFVNMIAEDLHDPRNQGLNFNPRTFPISDLTAAFLDGDENIAASSSEIEVARDLANAIWSAAWELDGA